MGISKYTDSTESKTEKIWIYAFRIIGTVMFIAGIWEAIYTLFNINKDVVPVGKYQVYFATVGFVLAFAGKSFGTIANNLGVILSKKLEALVK